MNVADQISAFFEGNDDVVAVYLFGSYASGKQRHGSDIDLGIIFKSNAREDHYQLIDRYLILLSRLLRRDLHIVPLNSASEVLLKQVFTKGECVLVNNSKKLAKFRMIAFSKIADFGYYQRKMQKGFSKHFLGADNG